MYLTIAVAGLAAIAKAFVGIFLLVKVLGGAYLLYLAYKLAQPCRASPPAGQRSKAPISAFLTGFSVTLGKPKFHQTHPALR